MEVGPLELSGTNKGHRVSRQAPDRHARSLDSLAMLTETEIEIVEPGLFGVFGQDVRIRRLHMQKEAHFNILLYASFLPVDNYSLGRIHIYVETGADPGLPASDRSFDKIVASLNRYRRHRAVG